MIQIELNERVWRIELDTPFPDNDEMWTRFIDLLQKEEFYGIDEDGPDERFYITTAYDTSMDEVYAAVERVLLQVLGDGCQSCGGYGVIPIPDTRETAQCDDCIKQDKCPMCGEPMTFDENDFGKCPNGHAWEG